jgi:hypothetical protein
MQGRLVNPISVDYKSLFNGDLQLTSNTFDLFLTSVANPSKKTIET